MYHLSIAEPPYLVRLVADEQPASVRIVAEIAFAQELERILGGAAEVARACGAAQRTAWDQACSTAANFFAQCLGLKAADFAIESRNGTAAHRP